MEEVCEVSNNDAFIRWVSRRDVHKHRLIHRSVHAFVVHPDGRFLLQLRHREKATYPHHWDLSCSGHVDRADHPDDDSTAGRAASDQAIQRELSEEIGVTALPTYVCDVPPISGVNYEYARVYVVRWNGTFVLQDTEVEAVRWVTLDEAKRITPKTKTLDWFLDHPELWTPER